MTWGYREQRRTYYNQVYHKYGLEWNDKYMWTCEWLVLFPQRQHPFSPREIPTANADDRHRLSSVSGHLPSIQQGVILEPRKVPFDNHQHHHWRCCEAPEPMGS
jgi:hypothetical protein